MNNLTVVKKEEEKQNSPNHTIIFYVGSDAEEFLVHKEFVFRHSPVLRAALTSTAKLQVYHLPSTTVAAFRLLSSFFYTGKLDLVLHSTTKKIDETDPKQTLSGKEHGPACAAQDLDLINLYILAGELKIPAVQTLVTMNMHRISMCCGPMSTSVLPLIWEKTPVGSPLRHLAVDQYCWQAPIQALLAAPHNFPKEMLISIACFLWNEVSEDTLMRRRDECKVEDYLVEDDGN
ncbi:hypothetical protein PVAG01_10839 [Phlyctema vagabunda]|uniref:BTB domain-containing protein n=1 Tax=Phlyctema vagabunda TaxID=108571 RepID=A0ABR4P3E3_9HELO